MTDILYIYLSFGAWTWIGMLIYYREDITADLNSGEYGLFDVIMGSIVYIVAWPLCFLAFLAEEW